MSLIHEVVPLGTQWPTLDPFLFCAHHLDRYPVANGSLGPLPALSGRRIGQDFAGIDGWNMYHGTSVPGFPQHPHRGFETVTYVRRGWCDHSDSLGARARFGEGDAQWLTAGRGIVHSEMFPLLSTEEPNPLHLFQIWLNLPAADKLVDPYFSMLWADTIPTVEVAPGATVTAIAGDVGEAAAPKPPPDSWAARDSGVEIWHVRLDADSAWTMPAAADGANRMVYVFEGAGLTIGDEAVGPDRAAVVSPTAPLPMASGTDPVEFLVLSGRPIGEPVAQYGPFVMNDRAGIEQTMRDYQATGFGGWPWPSDDPAHGPEPTRFADHPDGRTERPDAP